MPNPWVQAAATTAQGALGIGIQRAGARYDRRQQLDTQGRMMAMQMRGEKEMMDYQQQLAMDMWNNTNYAAQVEQMKMAGLSPGLMYGMKGGGGVTTGPGGSPGVTGGQAPYVDTTSMGMQMGMGMAQQRLMEAQANNLDADTEQKKGVGKEKIQAEIMDITQGIKNQEALNKLTQVQTEIQSIEKQIKGATAETAVDMAKRQLQKAEQEVMQLQIQTHIDKETQQDIIDTIKVELAGMVLRNALTKAQTTTEKGKPALQKAQKELTQHQLATESGKPALQKAEISIMEKQATDILRKAVQKWRELEISGQELNIDQQKELREELKTIAIPENIIDDIINGIILKKVITPQTPVKQKDWRFYRKSDNIENAFDKNKTRHR